MISFDEITIENQTTHSLNCPHIPDINHQPDIDRKYLAKDPYKAYQLLTNKCGNVGIEHYNDPKAFIDYLHDM